MSDPEKIDISKYKKYKVKRRYTRKKGTRTKVKSKNVAGEKSKTVSYDFNRYRNQPQPERAPMPSKNMKGGKIAMSYNKGGLIQQD